MSLAVDIHSPVASNSLCAQTQAKSLMTLSSFCVLLHVSTKVTSDRKQRSNCTATNSYDSSYLIDQTKRNNDWPVLLKPHSLRPSLAPRSWCFSHQPLMEGYITTSCI